MRKIICKDRLGSQHEVPAEELKFRPAAYAVIIKDNAVLLSKQWDGYDFPGGKIELGESIEEALAREVKEETGVDVKIGKIVAGESSFYKTLPGDSLEGDCLHSILLYYLCEITGGELSVENIAKSEKAYVAMPEWISLNDVEKIKFYNSIDSLQVIKKSLEISN